MSFFHDLFVDLVDKRLWPIAVVLAGAAIAVPVTLHKPAPAVRATVAPNQQPSTPREPILSGSPVSLGPSGFSDALSGEPLKDPFRQQHLPAPPKSVTSATTTSGGSTSSGTGTTGSGGTSSSGSTSTKRQATPAVKLRLKFGAGGSSLKTYEVAPMTALPSSSNPILIYLGLLKDGKTAEFLVSSDSTPQGDGKCKPSATLCQTLRMQAGDTELLDVDTGSGGTVQYQLEIDQIVKS
jgi:hypothetical protein